MTCTKGVRVVEGREKSAVSILLLVDSGQVEASILLFINKKKKKEIINNKKLPSAARFHFPTKSKEKRLKFLE